MTTLDCLDLTGAVILYFLAFASSKWFYCSRDRMFCFPLTAACIRGPKLCIGAEHIVIYLCSCVFLSHFGSDLNQSEDGLQLSNIILSAVS